MVDAIPLKPRKRGIPKFPPGFISGAIVKLKSGGSLMSISDQLSGEPLAVNCIWHSDGFHWEEHTIPVSCLRLATETEIANTVDPEPEEEDLET